MTFWLTKKSGHLDILKGHLPNDNLCCRHQLVAEFTQFDESECSANAAKTVDNCFREQFNLSSTEFIKQALNDDQRQLHLFSEWNQDKHSLTIRLEGYVLRLLKNLFGDDAEVRIVFREVESYINSRLESSSEKEEASNVATKGMKITFPTSQGPTSSSENGCVDSGICEDDDFELPAEHQFAWITVGNPVALQLFATVRVEVSISGFNSEVRPSSSERMTARLNRRILEGGMHADVKIIVREGKEVNAHKIFLAAQSPVFEDMFRNDANETYIHTLEIPEMSEESMRVLLAYLYYGDLSEAERSPEIALDLFEAGHRYKIPSVAESVKRILLRKPMEWMNVGEALRVYSFVGKMDGCETLLAKSIQIMKLKSHQLKESEEFQKLFIKDPNGAMELCQHAFSL